MPKIIIVEDDPAIAEMLQYHLKLAGYDITHFADGAVAHNSLRTMDYDLVILDIVLPNYNGLDLCRELHQSHPSAPIILLTSLDSEADHVVGLELGADDYLTKPFSMRECQARIKTLLRRCKLTTQLPDGMQPLHYEELTVLPQTREVIFNDEHIHLTQREFDLLFYFLSQKQQIFSRPQLLDAIWGHSYDGYEATVNTHINRLRNKLRRSEGKEDFIQTVWGIGYKFIALD
jgi:DNA-binding response OmpR family regulator